MSKFTVRIYNDKGAAIGYASVSKQSAIRLQGIIKMFSPVNKKVKFKISNFFEYHKYNDLYNRIFNPTSKDHLNTVDGPLYNLLQILVPNYNSEEVDNIIDYCDSKLLKVLSDFIKTKV